MIGSTMSRYEFQEKATLEKSVDASFYEYTTRYDLHCVMSNLCITAPQHGVGLKNGGIRSN